MDMLKLIKVEVQCKISWLDLILWKNCILIKKFYNEINEQINYDYLLSVYYKKIFFEDYLNIFINKFK